MDCATELYGILSLYFTGNKSRIKCLAYILVGLLKSSSSNLTKVAKNMPGKSKVGSKYRRIQRFFSEVSLDWQLVARYILSHMPEKTKIKLILDRTNWKFGNTDINFLVLSVAWRGLSLPIFWNNLGRAGNSNTIERMKILSEAVQVIGIKNIEVLLADREFIGEDWLHWLEHYKIKFVIRIKDNSLLVTSNKVRKAVRSFRTLSKEHSRYINCKLWGLDLIVVGYKAQNGRVHIIATNSNPENALQQYSIRWQIECTFLCLKSNGFEVESCAMPCPDKLNTLFGLLAILTCLNCKVGNWYHSIKPIKIKSHGRPSYNIFNYGMRIMSSVMNNINDYTNDFKVILDILILPGSKMKSFSNKVLMCA